MRFLNICVTILALVLFLSMEMSGQWKTSSAYGFYSISVTGNSLFAVIGDGWSKYKGIYRSTDGGRSWACKSNGLPSNADIIQITTDSTGTYALTNSNGIYKTSDNGESWGSISSDARATGGKLVVLSPSLIMIAKYTAIIVSTNGGVTWDTSKAGLPDGFSVAAAAGYGNRLLIALSAKGIYESSNSGVSWSALNSGLSASNLTAGFISVSQGNRIYTAMSDGKLYQLNYPNWSVINTTGVGGPSCAGYYNGALYAAIANSPKIFFTINNGSSWVTDTLTDAPNVHIQSLFPFNNSLVIATMHGTESNGLYSTSDRCQTYTQLSCAPACSVNTVHAYQNGRFFSGYFFTADSGKSWVKRSSGLLSAINSMANFGDTLLAGVQGGSSSKACVYRSTDDGKTWTYKGTGFSSTNLTILSVTRWNDRAIASAGDGIYVSTDRGEYWAKRFSLYSVSALCASSTHIFGALTSSGKGVAISSDGGDTWTTSNAGLNTSASAKAVAVFNGKLFLGTQAHGIYVSTNNGANWTSVNNGLPASFEVTSLASEAGCLFAGTYVSGAAKIYYTTDDGASWKDFSDGLPAGYRISSLKAFNGKLFAAANIGLFHRDLAEVTAVHDNANKNVPGSLLLEQNYPNPFNPTTVIRYSTEQCCNVSIKVFDLLGNEIITLVNGYVKAGTHEITFDSHGLASGIYLYRLTAGIHSEMKKMILLR